MQCIERLTIITCMFSPYGRKTIPYCLSSAKHVAKPNVTANLDHWLWHQLESGDNEVKMIQLVCIMEERVFHDGDCLLFS